MTDERTDEGRANGFLRLYRGQTSIDFVGRKRVWFVASLTIIIVGMASLGFRGLNLGIDFKGGSEWQVPATGLSQATVQTAMNSILPSPTVFILGGTFGGSKPTVTVQADLNSLSASAQAAKSDAVVAELAKLAKTSPNNVSTELVGPTWGSSVTNKAVEALIAFFLAVVLYITIRFEWKMAVSAIVAVAHDLLVTVGVYSLFGFQISPDTVVAILTILGYSLYDTVVVFDRVRDNAKGILLGGQLTYSEMVNLSMNQTLARSINTSMVAIIPVLSVLLIGAQVFGATTLQDYGLALVVGLTSGAYSSIFIASPLLAILKEREPRMRELRQRVSSRMVRPVMTPAIAAAAVVASDAPTDAAGTTPRVGPIAPSIAAPRHRPMAVTARARKPKKK